MLNLKRKIDNNVQKITDKAVQEIANAEVNGNIDDSKVRQSVIITLMNEQKTLLNEQKKELQILVTLGKIALIGVGGYFGWGELAEILELATPEWLGVIAGGAGAGNLLFKSKK